MKDIHNISKAQDHEDRQNGVLGAAASVASL